MKKMILWILALIMILSLCACGAQGGSGSGPAGGGAGNGGGSGSKNGFEGQEIFEKYESILRYVHRGWYGEAVDMITNLDDYIQENGGDSSSEDVSSSVVADTTEDEQLYQQYKELTGYLEADKIEDAVRYVSALYWEDLDGGVNPVLDAWSKRIIDTWIPTDQVRENGVTRLSVVKEGELVTSDDAYTLIPLSASEKNSQWDAYDGDERVYRIMASKDDNGLVRITLLKFTNSNGDYKDLGGAYLSSQHMVAELTKDNYDTYFEVDEVAELNSKGTHLYVKMILKLKDECGMVNTELTGNVVIDYDVIMSFCQFTADPATLTYTVGKVSSTSVSSHTDCFLFYQTLGGETAYGQTLRGSTWVIGSDGKIDTTGNHPTGYELVDIEGTMYLYNYTL